jgi:hypothetical protein
MRKFVNNELERIRKEADGHNFPGPSGRTVCGHSLAEIVGSNPTKDMDVCLL